MAGHADDFELLDRFARARDEPAFAEVVRRHLDLVYSSAVRRVGDRHLAEDVTQAVFVILAKRAKSVRSSKGPLSAWLLTAARYASANALRIESRRRKHEGAAAIAAAGGAGANGSGACSANPSDVIVWQEVAAQLDDAVLKLPAADRQAILMRYFEDRPISQIAEALRVSEGAAKMRLSRSVEKLRQRLERAGAGVAPAGAAGLATMLAAHAVRAAPAGLMRHALAASLGGAAATAATAGAAATAAAGAGTGTGAGIAIAKGAIAMMTWTKTKIAAAVVAAALLGTGTVLTVNYAGAQAAGTQDAPAADKADATTPEAPAAAEAENGGDDKASLATAPPVVVKTVPQSGATGIDPKTTEIRVTYSKPMKNGTWSWSTWGEENFPKTTGKPRYEADKRTCVLPVKLEPNKFYAIWLNSSNFGNFKDAGGRQAVPYLLVFRTK
jgi:RNA polymerase sigma-70 factor (ECF subfamily)